MNLIQLAVADKPESISRRGFLALSGTTAAMFASGTMLHGGVLSTAHARDLPTSPPKKYPIGIELYAVRGELGRDLPNTLRTVARIGYEVVEFYSPYLAWTIPYAKDVRTQLDDLGLRCFSTHNSWTSFSNESMGKAIEINQVLGARHLILASPPPNTTSLEDWKRASGQFTTAVEQLKPHGLFAGFHNHFIEWKPLAGGQRVMDVIAANTPSEFVLQFDVGTCLEAGQDPIAWIKANPGRIRSSHLKDWAPGTDAQEKGFRVLFGEGVGPWKEILATLESVGGVEFYLMEQEGSRYSEFETAKRCLDTWRAMRKPA
jgi:sugar phosphate isomerase/epimerase